MTVRHINLEALKDAFEELVGQIPDLLRIEVGLDFSAVEYACDAVLFSEFDSVASLQAYAQHLAHLAVKTRIGDMRTARHQVDYFPV